MSVVLQSKLIEKKQIAEKIFHLTFEKPPKLQFIPGQYIKVVIPLNQGGSVLRSYSLSSIPSDPNMELCIKLDGGGIGNTFLKNIKTNQKVKLQGPFGEFVSSKNCSNHCCIATGLGISPIISIIRGLLEKNKDENISLIFGLRYDSEIFWEDKLALLKKNYDNFSYKIIISRPQEQWQGKTGYVTEHIQDHLKKGHISNTAFYICGGKEMLKDVQAKLTKGMIKKENIRMEIF